MPSGWQFKSCKRGFVVPPSYGPAGLRGFPLVPVSAGRRTGSGEKRVGNTAQPCPPGTAEEKVAIQKLCLLLEAKRSLSGVKQQFCHWEDRCITALLYLLGLKLKRK